MMMPSKRFDLDLFDDMFKDAFFKNAELTTMKTDIKEKDGSYLLEIDLPGFNKDNIKASLEDGYLTISANVDENTDKKDEEGNYIYRERHTGKCSRTFYVGELVKEEDIKASYKDGILGLEFPKLEAKQIEKQKKYIAIN